MKAPSLFYDHVDAECRPSKPKYLCVGDDHLAAPHLAESPLSAAHDSFLIASSCMLEDIAPGAHGPRTQLFGEPEGEGPTASASSDHSSGSDEFTWRATTPVGTLRAPELMPSASEHAEPESEPETEDEWEPNRKRRAAKRSAPAARSKKAAASTAPKKAMRGSKRSAAASCQQQCAGSALEAAANKKHKIQGSLGIVTPFAIVKTLGFDGAMTLAQLNTRIREVGAADE